MAWWTMDEEGQTTMTETGKTHDGVRKVVDSVDARAVARHARRAQLRQAMENEVALRRLKLDEIIMRAHEQGLLYVPPTRYVIPRDHVCLACGAHDEHVGDCRPPVGLRRLTVKEIIARNAAPPAPEPKDYSCDLCAPEGDAS